MGLKCNTLVFKGAAQIETVWELDAEQNICVWEILINTEVEKLNKHELHNL